MAKHKFVAKVSLRGDFDLDDGLGVALQSVDAGQAASTDDKKLYDKLLEDGHIKSIKDAAKEETEEKAASSAPAPKVETNGGAAGKASTK